jgi:4-diphosphocytidyl-2C-methyl-D-erythritol kinase
VSTAAAYRWLDEEPPTHPAESVGTDQLSSWDGVARLAANDFEQVVTRHVPLVGSILDGLRAADNPLGPAELTLMSGSGSAVVRVCKPNPPAVNLGATSPGVTLLVSRTASFVEPVVRTH